MLTVDVTYIKGILESNKNAIALQKMQIMNRKKVIQNNLWEKLGLKVNNMFQGKGT
jgi:hypothetical protein